VLLEHEGRRLLLDCGYDDSEASGRSLSFPVPAGSIHAVVLSHGHLGHGGLLPVLVREGFAGKVYCAADTSRIATLGMLETALLQAEEKQYWVSKGQPELSVEPMYTESEVTACESLLTPCRAGERVSVDEHVTIEFFRAGHSPGSAFVKMNFRQGNSSRKILYIGDAGAKNNALCAGAVTNDAYDCLLLPVFRAARPDAGEVERQLAEIINRTCEAEGNVLVPVSSIDRRDAILQVIQHLSASKQIPSIFVFLDSPVASRQCEVLPLEPKSSKVYVCLRPIDTVEDSKSLNTIRGGAIIIAGSGRSGYGRIGFHLKRNLARPETALVLFGKQSSTLLGHSLDDGRKTLSIQGHEVEINAQIHRLEDPAVHLDASAATEWLARMKSVPQHTYIVHGAQGAKAQFRGILQGHGIPNVHVPAAGEKTNL
jgi:metallo-beta-lactamase family protein